MNNTVIARGEKIICYDAKEIIDCCLNCPTPEKYCDGGGKCYRIKQIKTKEVPIEDVNLNELTIGARIKVLRRRCKMSQRELAREADVMQCTISAWECGKTVPMGDYAQRVADVLGVSVETLCKGA